MAQQQHQSSRPYTYQYPPAAYYPNRGYYPGYNLYHYGAYPYYYSSVPYQQQYQPYFNGYQQQPVATSEGFSWKKLSKAIVQSLYEHMSSEFPSEEQLLLKAVQFNEENHAMLTFPFYDTDADGAITAEELRNTVRKFIHKNPSEFYMQQKIDLYDSDGNGSVDYDEYENMMGIPKMTDDKKFQQFDLFDKDNDGTITPEEIQYVLSSFALERTDGPAEDLHHQVQEIIGKYDIDGDGVLTHADIQA